MSVSKVIQSAWNGNERLTLVFWGYYVLGTSGISFLLGLVLVMPVLSDILILRTGVIFLGLTYFIWVVVSVWQCAFNVKNKIYGYIARIIVIFGSGSVFFRLVEWAAS